MQAQFGTLQVLLSRMVEKVQNHAARFVTGNFSHEIGRMNSILEHLKWGLLKMPNEFPNTPCEDLSFTSSVFSPRTVRHWNELLLLLYPLLKGLRIASLDLPA